MGEASCYENSEQAVSQCWHHSCIEVLYINKQLKELKLYTNPTILNHFLIKLTHPQSLIRTPSRRIRILRESAPNIRIARIRQDGMMSRLAFIHEMQNLIQGSAEARDLWVRGDLTEPAVDVHGFEGTGDSFGPRLAREIFVRAGRDDLG